MKSSALRLLHTALKSKDAALGKRVLESVTDRLRATGRIRMLVPILSELKKLNIRQSVLSPRVEAASESERKDALTGAANAGIITEDVSINPALITGWRASEGGRLIDTSGKRQLIELYRRVTK